MLLLFFLCDVETLTRMAAYRTHNVAQPQPVEFGGNLRGSGTIYVIYFELFLLESSNQTLYIESVIESAYLRF